MKELGLECGGKGPLVLHRDDSYQIVITVPVEIDLPQDNIQFELNYVDVTGMKRSQRYCVRPHSMSSRLCKGVMVVLVPDSSMIGSHWCEPCLASSLSGRQTFTGIIPRGNPCGRIQALRFLGPRYISGANPAQGDTRDNRPNPHSICGRGFVPVGASLRLEAHGLP